MNALLLFSLVAPSCPHSTLTPTPLCHSHFLLEPFLFAHCGSLFLFCFVLFVFFSGHYTNKTPHYDLSERHWPDLLVFLRSLSVTTVCPSCSPVDSHCVSLCSLFATFLFPPYSMFVRFSFVLVWPTLLPQSTPLQPLLRHHRSVALIKPPT